VGVGLFPTEWLGCDSIRPWIQKHKEREKCFTDIFSYHHRATLLIAPQKMKITKVHWCVAAVCIEKSFSMTTTTTVL
jgi:hypothetical protein